MACSSCQKAAARRAGSSATNALILGSTTLESEVYRVKVLKPGIPGLLVGAIKYVTGDGIVPYVDNGTLQILSTISNVRRAASGSVVKLYYVGELGYTSIDAARVRSEETGLPIEEKVI